MATGASTSKRIRLGLFITIGLVIFAAGIFMLGKQKNLFSKNIHLYGIFKNVSGLQAGNNVRFNGIQVGTVTGISILTDSTVRVDMTIKSDTRKFIKRNATAVIGSEGFIGNKQISINPGTPDAQPVNDGDQLATTRPLDTDDILKSLKKTSDNAALITTDMAAIFGRVNRGEGTVGLLLSDNKFAEDLKGTMSNVRNTTSQLGRNLNGLTGQLGTITSDVSSITTSVKNGKGALYTFTADTSVSNGLRRTMGNLNESSQRANELLEAAKYNFLFRSYFKKQRKNALKLDQLQHQDSIDAAVDIFDQIGNEQEATPTPPPAEDPKVKIKKNKVKAKDGGQ